MGNTLTVAKKPYVAFRNSELDPEIVKLDFPLLQRRINGKPLVYLDSAATSQKPYRVINSLTEFYQKNNANISRGMYKLSSESTAKYEELRDRIAAFIGSVDRNGVVFTRNTTESINLVARSWGAEFINEGDEILVSEMEHHSNLIPWMMIAKERKAALRYIEVTSDGRISIDSFRSQLNRRTRLVAVTHVSNVMGTVNPVAEIIGEAHKFGAKVLIDGAQSLPHIRVDAREMDVDFLAFSAHKMLGPTGIGILYAKPEILDEMDPYMTGGGMISDVSFDDVSWAEVPHKFEAGTPDFADAGGFLAALDYLESTGLEKIERHEHKLTEYALDRIKELPGIDVLGPADASDKAGVITFNDRFVHPHDLATALDSDGIAVRAGHHCVQPLMKKLGYVSTIRASFYLYNTIDDIDTFIESLKQARKFFGHG